MNKINIKPIIDRFKAYNDEFSSVFLIGIALESGGEINRQRLIAILRKVEHNSPYSFGQIKPEHSLGRKNLYHWKSKNLNEFFNDETLLSIYRDVIDNPKVQRNYEFTIEQLIDYVRLMVNKPRNWCIDWLYNQIFKPFLEGDHYSFNSLNLPIKVQKLDDFQPTGYCCEDCDGDYGYYRASQYENQVMKVARQRLGEYFISLKRYKIVDPKLMKQINEKNKNLYQA
jgi:hypothetical protein